MAILTTSYQRLGQAYLGTSGGNLYVRIYAKYSEQDIVNNRSKVQYQARAYYENSTYIYDQQGSGNVSGTSASTVSGSCTRPTTGETIIATTEAWVYHNNNGTKSISASAYLNFPNWNWSATASGSADLPTIPRASSIAVSNYNLGQNISITIGKKVSSFTSTLTYKIGSRTGTIVEKTPNSTYVWELPEELISQIKQDNPSNAKPSAIIYCETYNGTTKIGDTQSASFTLVIIDKPTITDIVITETMELIKQYTSSIVKYLSAPQFNIVATASEGTSISNYKVKIADKEINSSSDNVTTNNIQYSYLVDDIRKTKFIITVTDARGNISDEYPIEMDFIEYVQLGFKNTDIALTRLNSTSNFMKLHLTGYIYNGLIGETQNTLTLQYRYKLRNDPAATWSDLKIIEATINEDNTFSVEEFQLKDEFDYRQNYDIEFYIQDLFLSESYSTVIKTSETIVKVHKEGMYIKNVDTKQLNIDGKNIDTRNIIYDYILTENQDSIEITNLDIIRDGGEYEFELRFLNDGNDVSTDIEITFNNLRQGYHHNNVRARGTATTTSSVLTTDSAYYQNVTSIHEWWHSPKLANYPAVIKGRVFLTPNSGGGYKFNYDIDYFQAVQGDQVTVKTSGVNSTTVNNITSIKFGLQSSSYYYGVGTRVIIRKR